VAVAATLILGCASAAPPPKAPDVSTTNVTSATVGPVNPVGDTSDDFARQSVIVRPGPDYTANAEADAERVFAQMQPDLLACYVARVRATPMAHGYITMDVVIAPDGQVQNVETTGGALLSERALRCMTDRVKRAHFLPPYGRGTLRVHVPFALRSVKPGEEP
jgi:hypothetical protein